MTKRTLGQTDLRITPIGVGAWAIGGGKWEFAWGHQDDAESIAASDPLTGQRERILERRHRSAIRLRAPRGIRILRLQCGIVCAGLPLVRQMMIR
jgi:hypothetical protein